MDNLADKADSYVCGISDTPLLGETIGRSLDRAVRRWGHREALVSPSHGVRWTWTEFAERVEVKDPRWGTSASVKQKVEVR